jgi:dihydropyrimidinase
MKKYDIVIINGTIVTASDIYKCDIGIRNGKIEDLGVDLEKEHALKIINAEGKLVFPGGIDPHTHLDMPFGGTYSSDDFITGTKAAACGGTTTIIDFAIQPKGKSLHETVDIWREKANMKACIDYGLHIAITDINENVMNEIPKMINDGYPSFKLFMTYEDMRVNDDTFMKILVKVNENRGLTCVHAENHFAIKYYTEEFLKKGKVEPKYHAQSRPDMCEGEAASRAIKLAEMCGSPLYIVHNSCEASVSEIMEARAKGQSIMGETCPQYLLLSNEKYEEPNFNGAKYVMSPPLRDKKNWPFLWEAIKTGALQVIATDHCPFFMEQKKLGLQNFTKIPNGAPGIELRMALLYTYGFFVGKISLNRFVEITSTNAAKIFGLYPRKGTIAVGSDADLVIFDNEHDINIKKSQLNENVDYTPFEGFKLKGYPLVTISRGEVIAESGKYVGEEGRGEFIERSSPQII